MSSFESDVSLRLKQPLEMDHHLTYSQRSQLLSEQDRELEALYKGQPILETLAPRHVFNPLSGPAAAKLMECILTGEVDVRGQRVVDLGCGCGVIGLSCIVRESDSILFTDINPNIEPLKRHPMLRPGDEVKIQDCLTGEAVGSRDVVICSVPTAAVPEGREVRMDRFESGILCPPGFVEVVLEQAARVLVNGGTLLMWLKVSHRGVMPYHGFMMKLSSLFDLSSMKIHVHQRDQEMKSDYDDPGDPLDSSCLICSIRKKG